MTETVKPIRPDYRQAWVRGEEHISQEGTTYWEKLREARGWSRDDVYELTDYQLNPAALALMENDYGPGMPDMLELHLLAVLYGRKPGEMLDECYEQMGRLLLAEEEDAD